MATTTTSKKKTTTKSKATKPTVKAPVKKKTTAAARSKTSSTKAKNTKVTKKTTELKVPKPVPTNASSTNKSAKPMDIFGKLNMWNMVMAVLHTAQAVAVIVLSKSDSLFPVTTNFITTDALASTGAAPVLVQAQRNLFDFNLAYLVAAFFLMSAVAHLIIATVYRKNYENNLQKGINKARWYEYGISASTMMVAIAALSGVSDLSTIVMIFGATLVMNLLGLVMEVHNQTTEKTNWISYVVGTIAGLGPWAVVGIYFWGANQYGTGNIPTFVYYIYASIFVFFASFAFNMYLQYKGIGKWKDYLYGEKAYMVLSLVAKSALAWQIFVGTLRP